MCATPEEYYGHKFVEDNGNNLSWKFSTDSYEVMFTFTTFSVDFNKQEEIPVPVVFK
jgi:hypothetical protein